jgi:hypothetical protein
MKILLNENQIKMLIIEEASEKINKELIGADKLGRNIIKSMKSATGLDFTMLLTYSCAIGGFMGPLTEFLNSGEFNATEEEKILITAAIISTYFLDNSSIIKKIMNKIKESNLEDFYNFIDNKASTLKSVFIGFVDSLGILVGKISNMMAYTFIIPIIGQILQYSHSGDMGGIDEIVKRIAVSGLVNLSGITIREVIRKLIKRFSEG